MRQAIIRVFDELDHAEYARDALIESGFTRDAIEVSVREDEAGPVEGNFTVGNLPTQSQQHMYDNNYAEVHHRGHCMVTVQAADSDVASHAVAILERCGGRDPDPASR